MSLTSELMRFYCNHQVLEERQAQISDQLAELQHQQEESLVRREELVREMEIAQMEAKKEEEERERDKLTTRVELEEQVREEKQISLAYLHLGK